MHSIMRRAALLLIPLAAACGGGDKNPVGPESGAESRVRVINAFTEPVDVIVDGRPVVSALAPATIDTVTIAAGARAITFRSGATTTAGAAVAVTSERFPTVVAVRSPTGSLGNAVFDDTNSVVPAGATKMRVLHLAPNAGELQVYRTQPDSPTTPTPWMTPFTYLSAPSSTSAPFYQSTTGTWDIRVWKTPANASGWTSAPSYALFTLNSGEKGTLVILDRPGGGFRIEGL